VWQAGVVVEWRGWGGGGDKGSCSGQIGGALQLSSGGWGGDEVSMAAAVLVWRVSGGGLHARLGWQCCTVIL